MTVLTIGHGGEVKLPEELRERYGLTPTTPVRVIETKSGILLVPETGTPMSPELSRELSEWQGLGAEAWSMFP
jgi:bifunctional DNA-binding transcriptional regulator/antitoxin component of YhaV-PrlF toxin-antitoxin module